ncbi:hypothetical protein SteCoe_11449 [Stentor coeruleus]|uniref:Uncharacterized protein n=1 Tax=Stentor coeruleus TaxID=5963 RepID=A0A1R2CD59_9CILI|nr:hypothetical protein SteCoe_11449 [Stentor coeruleus]
MQKVLPFFCLLLLACSHPGRIFIPAFLEQPDSTDDGLTDKEEDDMASEELVDIMDEDFAGISTDLAEGEEFTAYVPEEYADDEILVAETEDVDDILDAFEGVTVKEETDFYDGTAEVADIAVALDGDEQVVLRDKTFDDPGLDQALIDAEELHEASMMSEGINDLEECWDEIEETGEETIENLEDQVVAANQILNYMDEFEIIKIDGVEYDYAEVEALVAEIEAELDAALAEAE